MSDSIKVNLSVAEVGVRPGDSAFEEKCLQAAQEKAVGVVSDWERVGLHDIEVDGDAVVVHLRRSEAAPVPPPMPDSPPAEDWPVGEPVEQPQSEEAAPGPSSEEIFVSIEGSAAYEGPLGDRRFEVDIVDLCAMLDVMGFTQQIAQAAGATSPTIARSLKKLEMMLAGYIATEDAESKQKRPSDEFLQHMNVWMKESSEMFEKVMAQQQKRVVRAQMVPGPNFDPTGANVQHPGQPMPPGAASRMAPPPVHIPGGSRRR